MTLKYADEIKANLARAQQSVEAAQELAAGGYADFAASRAYYAAFYGATALVTLRGADVWQAQRGAWVYS